MTRPVEPCWPVALSFVNFMNGLGFRVLKSIHDSTTFTYDKLISFHAQINPPWTWTYFQSDDLRDRMASIDPLWQLAFNNPHLMRLGEFLARQSGRRWRAVGEQLSTGGVAKPRMPPPNYSLLHCRTRWISRKHWTWKWDNNSFHQMPSPLPMNDFASLGKSGAAMSRCDSY